MIRHVIRRPLPSLGLGGEAPGNRANPFCNSIRCKPANRTPPLRVWRNAGLKESICYGSWNCRWALFVSLGPRPGPRSLSVKLPLGPRPAPRTLSVAGLDTAVGHVSFWAQGRVQGVYLLRVLKLLLGKSDPGSLSGHFRWAQGCYRSWNCGWANFVPLDSLDPSRAYLLRVLKLPLGPRPCPRGLSVTGLEAAQHHLPFHWAQGLAQGIYLLRV